MNKNVFYEQLISYMGEPVKGLDINRHICGCLSDGTPRIYYKLKAQKPYIAVSIKTSCPDFNVRMINAGVCEEIQMYGESETQADDLLFPELFRSFDAGRQSPAGYVTAYLFPVTVSDVYLLSLSADNPGQDGCLFAFIVDYFS